MGPDGSESVRSRAEIRTRIRDLTDVRILPGRHGGRVGVQGRVMHGDRDCRPGVFLVEFSAPSMEAGHAEAMHAALQHAVARLRAGGTPIRWCGAWLVPAEQRCLCFIEASAESAVVLARDTAALTGVAVRSVRALPGRAVPSRPLRIGGRY
jgi:hypothetical protein